MRKNECTRSHDRSRVNVYYAWGAEISKAEKPEDRVANKKAAQRGGNVAGNARIETEKELGRSVINHKNYLQLENDGLSLLSQDQIKK